MSPSSLRHLAGRFLLGKTSPQEDRDLILGVLGAPLDVEEVPSGETDYGPLLDAAAQKVASLELAVAQVEGSARRLATEWAAAGLEDDSALLTGPLAEVKRRSVEVLLDQSQTECSRSPVDALHLAVRAQVLALHLIDQRDARAHDLCAQALAQVSNVRRIQGDFLAAHTAMAEAKRHLGRGVGEPRATGDVWSREAGLLSDESRFPEALRSSRRASRCFAIAFDERELLRCRLQQANLLFLLDRTEEALATLERTRGDVERSGDSRFRLALSANRALYLVELGRLPEARAELAVARGRIGGTPNLLDGPRLDWVESRIAAAEGNLQSALQLLESVRARYLDFGLAHDVALASLEAALLLAQLGDLAKSREWSLEAFATFEALRVQPEALASLQLATETMRGQALVVEALRAAVKRLRR